MRILSMSSKYKDSCCHPDQFSSCMNVIDKRVLNVALLGHNTESENLGISAFSLAQLAILDEVAERLGVSLSVDVFAGRRKVPGQTFGRNIAFRLIPDYCSPKRILRGLVTRPFAFRRCDLIIDMSDGDSFADIYGWQRALLYISLKLIAEANGRKLIVAPMTIGPWNHPFWRRLAGFSLRHADHVFARDEISARFAQEELHRDSVICSTDLAMVLPYEKRIVPRDMCCLFGLNISGLLWTNGYTGSNEFGIREPYADSMRKAIRALLDKGGVRVVLVAHVFPRKGVQELDIEACRELQREFPSVEVAPEFRNPIEAKSYISGFDIFAGARMHSCIAAFSSGVPLIPLAYSRKFDSLFGSLGYRRTVDLRSASSQEIAHALCTSVDQLQEIRAEVEEGNEKVTLLLEPYKACIYNNLKMALERE